MCKNIRARLKGPFLIFAKVWYNITKGGAFGINAMVASLEEYVAQATQAYKPASNAIQSQLDALDSRLATTNEQINRNYTQQQADLNRSRNMAAESASMQAAGSGGSFGGSANLANRRYYDKTFVPAVTQMKTNQANDLATARQNIEDTRNNLNSQMANIEAQANQQALAQYYADQEAERNRAIQQQQIAAQNAYNQYLMEAYKQQQAANQTKKWDFGNGFALYQGDDGRAIYTKNGNQISAGQFLTGTGASGPNWDMWNDVWDNGVNTYGVGSDTVDLFGGSLLKAKQANNYNDLFMV